MYVNIHVYININKYIQVIFRKHLPSNRTKEHLPRVRHLRCAPRDPPKKKHSPLVLARERNEWWRAPGRCSLARTPRSHQLAHIIVLKR